MRGAYPCRQGTPYEGEMARVKFSQPERLRGIGHALRALFRREGVDQQMGGADESLLHGSSALLHPGLGLTWR